VKATASGAGRLMLLAAVALVAAVVGWVGPGRSSMAQAIPNCTLVSTSGFVVHADGSAHKRANHPQCGEHPPACPGCAFAVGNPVVTGEWRNTVSDLGSFCWYRWVDQTWSSAGGTNITTC
jgi:hypothetical protein